MSDEHDCNEKSGSPKTTSSSPTPKEMTTTTAAVAGAAAALESHNTVDLQQQQQQQLELPTTSAAVSAATISVTDPIINTGTVSPLASSSPPSASASVAASAIAALATVVSPSSNVDAGSGGSAGTGGGGCGASSIVTSPIVGGGGGAVTSPIVGSGSGSSGSSTTSMIADELQITNVLPPINETDARELREIKQMLWGDNVRDDVFKRWSQGFEFSDVEPSALVQKQGGPCAVIAPVQAYLLKIIIMDMPGVKLSEIPHDKCQSLLIRALCNILKNCRTPRYRIVTLLRRSCGGSSDLTKERRSSMSPGGSSSSTDTAATLLTDALKSNAAAAAAALDLTQGDGGGGGGGSSSTKDANRLTTSPTTITTTDRILEMELTPNEFHQRLHTLHFDDIGAVARYYIENYGQLSHAYGVLLFMYSVFLTKGTEQVAVDNADNSEPLIHSTYGYGAQSLINLMLTGRAVAHVWDNEQDVGGLKLRGLYEQSDIGFITLMEQMRYCTVGSFFKNPRYPVWVMGSDTHLTVLFSNEKRLVSPETPSETARRIFKSFDPEGNNFISSNMLREVLAGLNLVSEPAYVNIMQKRLDPENLGIILLNGFMDEFFPMERRSTPDTFELYHYNGIPGSNENNKVRYYCGSAIILEGDLKSVCISNPVVTCLQTKWPNIEINWYDGHLPSLN